MLKLPQCPYCSYKSDYSHARKAMTKKEIVCRKCGKRMTVSYKKASVPMGLIFLVVLIALNTMYLYAGNAKTLLPNLIFTVVIIAVFAALVPLKVTYGKIEGEEDEPPKLKKNRHRHKKSKGNDVSADENPLKNTSFDT